jgi:hypothetical protein
MKKHSLCNINMAKTMLLEEHEGQVEEARYSDNEEVIDVVA